MKAYCVNFGHPFSAEAEEHLRSLLGVRECQIIEVSVQVVASPSLEAQMVDAVQRVGMPARSWETEAIVVNLPSYAPAAVMLLAVLNGRMGHFPPIVRLTCDSSSTLSRYLPAEIIDLNGARSRARSSRAGVQAD